MIESIVFVEQLRPHELFLCPPVVDREGLPLPHPPVVVRYIGVHEGEVGAVFVPSFEQPARRRKARVAGVIILQCPLYQPK